MGRCSLYRHFDVNGQLLYVGISNRHLMRLSRHRVTSSWYWDINHIKVEHFAARAAVARWQKAKNMRAWRARKSG